ncbi:hypothetical protein PAI11_20560 [Patulibacter medicamentivorans]|uniref:Uncharacterized protein n=1 Tax=Patulibacter medicamentivorans TaxID=1097667 RepID=H0E5G5_9ACTN|nr:hypothetical protein PAI11_20560 [Patulibacter medicamentivorans]
MAAGDHLDPPSRAAGPGETAIRRPRHHQSPSGERRPGETTIRRPAAVT